MDYKSHRDMPTENPLPLEPQNIRDLLALDDEGIETLLEAASWKKMHNYLEIFVTYIPNYIRRISPQDKQKIKEIINKITLKLKSLPLQDFSEEKYTQFFEKIMIVTERLVQWQNQFSDYGQVLGLRSSMRREQERREQERHEKPKSPVPQIIKLPPGPFDNRRPGPLSLEFPEEKRPQRDSEED